MTYRIEHLKVMKPKQEKHYRALVWLWLVANSLFWLWWLRLAHIGNRWLYSLFSLAFFYEYTFLPSMYLFFLGRMRRPRPVAAQCAERANLVKRVAVISLTVPGSESIELARRQMMAMKAIRYPHDSWILVDKEHSPEIAALARQLGVGYFCRHDEQTWGKQQIERWNQPVPPFQRKTKAGNVNSWIDAFGDRYSHFTQFDIDHLPVPSYLDQVLGFFLDRKVKWVQAPSVYGNLDVWTARGSAELELVLQGPLQMGFFGFSRTPFIIGSHCTYEMQAIREIGGFQPTRAEDHLDTVLLASHGYEGVFLPIIIAVGDGPEDFETYLSQQFAWAFSMIQVLFSYTPRLLTTYTPRLAVQMLFVQTWYTCWSLSMMILFLLPIISLLTNVPISRVSYGHFMLRAAPLFLIATITWRWSRHWHKPYGLALSWRGIALHVVRWITVLNALIQVVLRVQKPYMITVKGMHNGTAHPFALVTHYPYLTLFLLSLFACWFHLLYRGRSETQGNLLFALQGAGYFLLVFLLVLLNNLYEMRKELGSWMDCLCQRKRASITLGGLVLLFVLTTLASSRSILEAVLPPRCSIGKTPARVRLVANLSLSAIRALANRIVHRCRCARSLLSAN